MKNKKTSKTSEKERTPGESVLYALEGARKKAVHSGVGGDWFSRTLGQEMINTGLAELKPKGEIVRGMGEALEKKPDDPLTLTDTLQMPDAVSLSASKARLVLAGECGALEMALDAGNSLKGANSIERMLLHQMAACHKHALRLLAKAESRGINDKWQGNTLDAENKIADITSKLVNASARLMSVYQAGAQTLVKLRTGGRQQVIVQHIHVNGEAQAVVAGKMDYPDRGQGGGQDET